MDFASLMSSQIASSKPRTEEGGKKYLKRGEVEAQRQADYQRDQEELEKARLERVEKKRKREEDEAEHNRIREEKRQRLAEEGRKKKQKEDEAEERERRKRIGLPELEKLEETSTESFEDSQADIPEDELLTHLRDLGEPRKLFAETHPERLRRYRRLTSKALAKKQLNNGPIPTTLALLPEAEMKVPATVPADPSAHPYLLRQIASYFDMVLRAWQLALARRPREVRESLPGKQAHTSFTTALSNLKPLYTYMETDTLAPELLAAVNEIVHLAQLKRYVHANDAYLRLSIGKAAWPIGVTMVGIHERSAREKLHGNDAKANIMGDEVTRKLLQGIKRCLSFAQTRWPPEDAGQIMG